MADKKPVDQVNFNEVISKPVGESEADQKYNRILQFEEDGSIGFNDEIEDIGENAYIINSKNILGFRGDFKNNDNVGDLTGDNSRTKTVIGEATKTENFVYNGGTTTDSNVPNYFNKDSKLYSEKDFEARVNATYIVDGMVVNQLRTGEKSK